MDWLRRRLRRGPALREIPLDDLGPELAEQFRLYLREHLGRVGIFNEQAFIEAASRYFDQHAADYTAIDRFFNKFTLIWRNLLQRGFLLHAEREWVFAVRVATDWEKLTGRRMHKGTPYYFWGMTSLLGGDVDRGFLQLHQSLDEDRITHATDDPNTPGMNFVRLDDNSGPLSGEVAEVLGIVDTALSEYGKQRGGTLPVPDFRAKFLEARKGSALRSDGKPASMTEVVFQFTYTSFRLRKLLKQVPRGFQRNSFAAMLQASILFDLCVCVDQTIRTRWGAKGMFKKQIEFLAKKRGLGLAGRLEELNDDFKGDAATTVRRLLDGSYNYKDGTAPVGIEVDFALAYGLRNLRAHEIAALRVVWERFDELVQAILNSMFYTVETPL